MSKQSYDNNVAQVSFPVSSSRIRLPAEVAKSWGAPDRDEPFSCDGYFRLPGELLCLPEWGVPKQRDHPFEALDGYQLEAPEPGHILGAISIVPSAQALLARYRFVTFQAKWAAPARKQLDLQVGGSVCERLGPEPFNVDSFLYMVTWGVVLAIYSESAFQRFLENPLRSK